MRGEIEMEHITAGDLRNSEENLIGRKIETQQIGDWPGGLAEIIKLDPDPAAPEIVFNVKNKHGEVGVFDWEIVYV